MRATRVLLAGSLSLSAAFAGLVTVADVALAAPTTRYVSTTGVDGTKNCDDKADPCRTIAKAVSVSEAGDTVQIAKGAYPETVTIAKSLTLQGDPAGGTIIVGTDDDPSLLLGGPNGQDGPPAITLRNLDISGNASAPGVVALGAAVRLVDSHVDRNYSGVVGLASLIVLQRSTASGNRAGEDGNSPVGFGAGVVTLGGAAVVEQSTLAGNEIAGVVANNETRVAVAAAAPAADDTDVTIVDSTVSGNGQVGVASQGGSLDVDTSTISGNGSVGVYGAQSTVTVRNSTVAATGAKPLTGNQAPTKPAGIYNETRDFDNDDRLAPRVTAFGRTASKVAFGKRTVSLRAAPQRRAAAAPIGITVSGTALDQTGSVADCVAATDGGYNSSADATNSCGFSAAKNDLVRTNPKLGALANNGGPTRTHLPAAGSPLLNRIPAGRADCVKGATDQRGVARPQAVRCDIGAVEPALAPVKITTKSLPDGQAGDKYRKQLSATGGDGDYAWAVARGSSLPDGLTLSRDGVLSGTPAKAGTFRFTVTADGASKRFTLVIDESGAGPNGDGQDPIAETGAPSAALLGWGTALVLGGLAVLMAAGHIGRRPGRHRSI